jgi:transcriptional regulator with XRE-family HTH domain
MAVSGDRPTLSLQAPIFLRPVPIEGETRAGRNRRLAASKEGSQIVADEFGKVLTRKRLAERLGVHPHTVARWEQVGVVKPKTKVVLGSRTKVFDESDVALGKLVLAILQAEPGRVSLREAAKRARQAAPPAKPRKARRAS